jgi:ribose-phosphate pyrophosphokinase
MIVPGSTSQALAARLASETGRGLVEPTVDRFPDGELLAAIPGFEGDRATIVCSTTSPAAHIECLQLQDAARAGGADHVTTVIPYMGYGRQDAAFEPGQPNSARAVARAIATGSDRVILVTPHEPSIADRFGVPTELVDGIPALAPALPDELFDPAFVAPDASAAHLAESLRDAHGAGAADHFEKTRLDEDTVAIEPSGIDTHGRTVVLVDDIVATGGTISEAVGACDGAEQVIVACVHAVLAGSARTRLARAGVDRIVATDTVERAVTETSVAPAIAEAL